MSIAVTNTLTLSHYMTLFVGLFAMMNPLGNAAIFLSLTSSQSAANQKKTAMSCSIAVMIILMITVWIGTYLLKLFGISIASLTVAGGIIVLLIGLNMLSSGSKGSNTTTTSNSKNVAVVPLAIPLIAGPGTMSTILAHTYLLSSFESKCFVSLVCVAAALVILCIFLMANKIEKLIGENGLLVVTRIMGLILCGIAIQLLATGLPELFPVLKMAAASS